MDAIGLMGLIYGSWRRKASAALEAFGITLPQYRLIQIARWRGGISPSAAARELGSDRPTTTQVARSCIERGWLSRKAQAEDGRSFRLSLTGQGEEILDRIEASRILSPQLLGDPFDILDSEERSELLRLLDRANRRAGDVL